MVDQFPPYPRFGFSKVNFIIYLICLIWVLLLLITPLVEPPGNIQFDDEGYVGLDENYSYDL